ncbi:MAG: hypothetical protein N3E47_00540 [Candidatus Bathyarchaeota archaeon]|nr:hypothetical protein [Candidatus Bathyarchaeota archaeon]
MESLKREFLELLDRDLEFRYAVAGYLGLSEILKRLDMLSEGHVRLAEEQRRLAEEQRRLAEEQRRFAEEQRRLAEEQRRLTEEQTKIWMEIAKLREDFDRMYRQLDARLTRVERTLEKITLDIEEEARIVVKYRLREMGYRVEIASLILPEVELNIYGISDDLCVIGEASVRASSRTVDEVNIKVDRLRSLYPDKLKPKIIKVIYTSLAMPDLIERAEKEGIWVLKATGDIVEPKNLSL